MLPVVFGICDRKTIGHNTITLDSKDLGSTSIIYRPETFASDRYLVDVDPYCSQQVSFQTI